VLTLVTQNQSTPAAPAEGGSMIDEIVRDGARRMLAAALEAEVAAGAWSCATATPTRGRC
jgi:hypothetical protein